MRIILTILLALHGLVHLFVFTRIFGWIDITLLAGKISKPFGMVSLAAGLLMVTASYLHAKKTSHWWLLAFISILLSQFLVFYYWVGTFYWTVANLLIFLFALVDFSKWKFDRKYKYDILIGLERIGSLKNELLEEQDIKHLPALVQKYLIYTGSIGKPKVKSMKVEFAAEMRGKKQDWFSLTTSQHNFFDQLERFFFMKAIVKGLPARGYHLYRNNQAGMKVKMFSMIPIVKKSGKELFIAETVTLLNDMCFLAPPSLIDKRIQWEEIDHFSVKAFLTNQGTTVSAILHFNEMGQLINFVSRDRYDINEMKQYTFSTPIKDYREINGYQLAHYGEAIWHYPGEEFVYGKYHLKDIRYNI